MLSNASARLIPVKGDKAIRIRWNKTNVEEFPASISTNDDSISRIQSDTGVLTNHTSYILANHWILRSAVVVVVVVLLLLVDYGLLILVVYNSTTVPPGIKMGVEH